jgi:hypothetical protein
VQPDVAEPDGTSQHARGEDAAVPGGPQDGRVGTRAERHPPGAPAPEGFPGVHQILGEDGLLSRRKRGA